MSKLEQDIKDRLQKVCICKAITQDKIKRSIREGAETVEAVAKVTGATSGGCRGNRCKPKIQELIDTYKEGEWQ